MATISIFGGGAWGRALAFAFSQRNEVKIISRKNLCNLAPNIIQVDTKEGLKSEFFIIAIATNALRDWLENISLPKESKILSASKGIETKNSAFVSDIYENFTSQKNIVYLCGPSFASEVIQSLPCALVLHSRNLLLAREFGRFFPNFIKTYTSPDVIGGEIAGAYKNVIAIAGGICDGLNLGANAKASLLARGLVEMSRFGETFGGKMETFLGLSGAGDLFLTSNSKMSRNYRVGLGLAQGLKIDEILNSLGEVAEGVVTAQAIKQISLKEKIHTPIAREVCAIIEGKDVKESLNTLMDK